jgi:pimeloyl-ACP methyl ester carboxylesterase
VRGETAGPDVIDEMVDSPITTRFRTIDGLSIRFAESEPREEHALLLSPWPESLLAFEQIWAQLAEHAHLVAIDLPGYGHSDAREDLYPPHAMGEFVIRLLDEFELEHPHAVGPDIGTAALLFAASSRPERFRSLVVGTGSASVPLQLGVELKQFVEAPDVEFLRGVDPRDVVNQVLNYLERYELPDSTREDCVTGYLGDRFIDSLKFVRAYPEELPILAELLPQVQTPVQIIQGDHDPAVLPVNAEFLDERLPTASSTSLTRATSRTRTAPRSTRRSSATGGGEAMSKHEQICGQLVLVAPLDRDPPGTRAPPAGLPCDRRTSARTGPVAGRPTRDVSERTRATSSDSAALRSHCGVAMILRG